MKKLLLSALLFCTSALGVNAQENEIPSDELSVSWGIGTVPHLIEGFSDALSSALVGDNASENTYGVFSVQYMHNINQRFGIGVAASYEYIYKDGKDSKKHSENYFTVMPTVRAYWFRGNSVGMYSRVAVGASLNVYNVPSASSKTEQTHTDIQLAYHAAPVAVEVGNNKVSGFLELGFGYQGIVNVGVKFGL